MSTILLLTVRFLRLPRCLLASLLCACVLASPVKGAIAQGRLPAEQALDSLHHTSWTLKEGVPGMVVAIAQTSDGYLWLGTVIGLYRFDGVKFESFQSIAGEHLTDRQVRTLHAVDNRGLWVGLDDGVALVRDGHIEVFDKPSDQFMGSARAFATDRDGTLWFAMNTGLYRREAGRWKHVGKEDGLGPQELGARRLQDAKLDGDGNLWVTADDTLYVKPTGKPRFEARSVPGYGIFSGIAVAPDGRLWASGEAPGPRDMTGYSKPVRLHRLPRPGRSDPADEWLPATAGLNVPIVDRGGAFWYAGAHGVVRDRENPRTDGAGRVTETFSVQQGLSGDRVFRIFQDREGAVWVGTTGGLDRFRGASVNAVRFPQTPAEVQMAKAPNGDVWFSSFNQPFQRWRAGGHELDNVLDPRCTVTRLIIDRAGRLVFGCNAGMWRQEGARLVPLPDPPKALWRGGSIVGLIEDLAGQLWIIARPVGVLRLRDGTWEPIARNSKPGLLDAPTALAVDSAGRILVGFSGGNVAVFDAEGKQQPLIEGLRVGRVRTITVNGDHVWIAGDSGVQLISAPGRPLLQTTQASATAQITGLVEMPDGDLWLNGINGISHVAASEVAAALQDPKHTMAATLIGSLDGLNGRAAPGWGRNAALSGNDGTLWFTLNNGAVRLDQARWRTPPSPLSLDIQRVIADGVPLPVGSRQGLTLAPGVKDLEILYTAPGAHIPERVRFRYRLDGLESTWHDVGARRQAFYMNLDPGPYRFLVQASLDGQSWTEGGASIAIEVPPTLTQTWWFRGAMLIGAGSMLGAAVLWRIRAAARRERERMLVRMQEREHVAQDLHDTLLQGVMSLVLRLDVEGRAQAQGQGDRLRQLAADADAMWLQTRDRVMDLRMAGQDDDDIERVLRELCAQLSDDPQTALAVRVEGQPRRLSSLVGAEATLIAREAVFNAFRHAKASRIDVVIEFSALAFRVHVTDDGVGIPVEVMRTGGVPGHWGLGGMKARAKRAGAEFKVTSAPGSGTVISVAVPSSRAYATAAASQSSTARRWRTWRRVRRDGVAS